MFKNLFRKKVKAPNARRFKRFRANYLVKYEVSKGTAGRVTNARDIGAGGLRFWSEEKLPESSLLNVSIYIPPLKRVVEGVVRVLRVRRVKKTMAYSIAVSFLDLKHEDREAINRFAESISTDRKMRFMIDHADIVVRRT